MRVRPLCGPGVRLRRRCEQGGGLSRDSLQRECALLREGGMLSAQLCPPLTRVRRSMSDQQGHVRGLLWPWTVYQRAMRLCGRVWGRHLRHRCAARPPSSPPLACRTLLPARGAVLCEKTCQHGTCSQKGDCVCDGGWMGDNCDDRARRWRQPCDTRGTLLLTARTAPRSLPATCARRKLPHDGGGHPVQRARGVRPHHRHVQVRAGHERRRLLRKCAC